MNIRTIACTLLIGFGAFVAGSEVVDLFIAEANFTTDHFILGAGQIALSIGFLKPK